MTGKHEISKIVLSRDMPLVEYFVESDEGRERPRSA